jgi:hypothetical protein
VISRSDAVATYVMQGRVGYSLAAGVIDARGRRAEWSKVGQSITCVAGLARGWRAGGGGVERPVTAS